MANEKYTALANGILEAAGGADNIAKVSHCFTRLRLDLVDLEKCDVEALKQVKGTKGCVVNNGQVQVIIGTEVEDFYPEFLKVSGKKAEAVVDENLDEKKENLVNRIINSIAQIFIPTFPALAAGGLLKGLLVALMFSGKVDTTTGTFNMLMMFSDAAFYFLPFYLAYTTAQVFKIKPVMAMVLAGVILHPTYTGLAEATNFLGLNIPVVDYSSTVFPIIIGVIVMSYIDKFARKIIPNSFAGIFVPLIDLLIAAPIMLVVVGPLVNTLSTVIGTAVINLYEATGAIGGAVFGALYPVLVFFGLHHAVVPVELQSLATLGYDPLLALCAAANAAVAGAALMVAIDSKNKEFKGLSFSSAISSIIGITEPTLYGVLGILKRPFAGVVVGGAVGAAIMAAFKVYGLGIGPVPLAGIALFFGEKFPIFLIGIAVSVIVSMVVTHIVKFEDVEL
ncbi:MAG: PTS transporter subunit EIIC [Erysipelotrichaceae bacterium]|nr:PTS transporter subunit EIIC [Erysipelotrichaceae bacterium]